ncbi:MAG: sigma-70 family RNA polymerase sigma factor [Gammaproteobacteria bacterium]|nr:sigma-70 family RNA polymerase sigma factor [Gammaproteobacteria bacterium]
MTPQNTECNYSNNHARESARHRLFNQLYRRYEGDLRRYAYWLAGDKHTAEDLVQETLLRAWRSVENLHNTNAAKGWLLTILRRENARRFERFQPVEVSIPVDVLTTRECGHDTSTEAFVLHRALDGLADEYRTPLIMQVIDGYSQKEIAKKIGITPAGVGTRLFRAREKLRGVLAA